MEQKTTKIIIDAIEKFMPIKTTFTGTMPKPNKGLKIGSYNSKSKKR